MWAKRPQMNISSSYKDWAWLVAVGCIMKGRFCWNTQSCRKILSMRISLQLSKVCVLRRKETGSTRPLTVTAHMTTALGLNFIIQKTKRINQKISKIPALISSEIYIWWLLLETPFLSGNVRGYGQSRRWLLALLGSLVFQTKGQNPLPETISLFYILSCL